MNTRLLLMLFLLCAAGLHAHGTMPPEMISMRDAETSASSDSTGHILFEGVEVKGDIYTFYKILEKRKCKLTSRLRDANQYAMKGFVAGNECDFLISYTRNTRTVYRIMVRPKHVSVPAYLDSLKVRYGEPYDFEDETYKWMLPTGMVMFKTPDGYDPTLVIIDAIGFKAYKEEEN